MHGKNADLMLRAHLVWRLFFEECNVRFVRSDWTVLAPVSTYVEDLSTSLSLWRRVLLGLIKI